jgi:hypothetical protein
MAQVLLDYIKQHGLHALEQNFAISIKRHLKYPNLVLLKYNQIESPLSHPVVRECRGIILDEANNWQVISYPYRKFFNYGEGHADEIDWKTARVYEKLDGSLMTIYYYDDHWEVASSGLPDASGQANMGTITFSSLFWKTWTELGYKLPEQTDYCFMFELMTPYNRVVVRHPSSRLVLHGVRRLTDGQEFTPEEFAKQIGCECVQQLPLNSWENILEAAKTLDPMEHEGYVVCDGNFHRVKMKSPQYVAVSHLKEGMSVRNMLELIRINESAEFLTYYPEYTELYNEVKAKFTALVNQVDTYFQSIKHIDDRKAFAMEAKDHPQSGILFGLKQGKIKSILEGLAEMNIKVLENWLHLKEMSVANE